MKFCIDCKWFHGRRQAMFSGAPPDWVPVTMTCANVKNTRTDLVTGDKHYICHGLEMHKLRENEHKCGKSGKWWEKK
jgi:hypothetical protein